MSLKTQIEGHIGSVPTTYLDDYLSSTAKEIINILPDDALWGVSNDINDAGGGSGATVSLTISSGVITNATVSSGGSDYKSDPEIIITDSSGSGSGAKIRGFIDTGALVELEVVDGGSDYSDSDTTASVVGGGGVSISTNRVLYAHKNNLRAEEVPASMAAKYADSGSIYKATDKSPVFYKKNGKGYVLGATAGGTIVAVAYPNVSNGDNAIGGFPDEFEPLVVIGASIKALQKKMADKSSDLPANVVLPPKASLTALSDPTESIPTFVSPSPFVMPEVPADVDIDFSGVAVPSMEEVPSISSPEFSSYGTVDSTDFGTEPTFVSPVLDTDFSSVDTDIAADDVELARSRLDKINSQISEFSTKINEATGKFTEANTVYQSKVSAEVQNASNELQRETKEFEGNLAKYSSEVQQRISSFGADFQVYGQKIQKAIQAYSAETGFDLSKLSANVQGEINRFQSDLAKSNADFQSGIVRFEADVKKVSAINQRKLAEYNASHKDYTAESAAEIQNYSAAINKHATDYQWLANRMGVLVSEYARGLQMIHGREN